MAAYAVFDIDVRDPERYEEYKKRVPPTIAQYGGRYLTRGGRPELLEGDWDTTRLVILEFASVEQAKAWLESEEYREARGIRQSAAITRAVVVPGV